jgi:hypothetical protein
MHFNRAADWDQAAKYHANSIFARLRAKFETVTICLSLQKGVRNLDHHVPFIACIWLDAAAHDESGWSGPPNPAQECGAISSVDVDHHADATSVMLKLRIIQSLFGRQSNLLVLLFTFKHIDLPLLFDHCALPRECG